MQQIDNKESLETWTNVENMLRINQAATYQYGDIPINVTTELSLSSTKTFSFLLCPLSSMIGAFSVVFERRQPVNLQPAGSLIKTISILYHKATQRIQFHLNNGAVPNFNAFSTDNSVRLNTISLITISYNQGTVSMYVNGVYSGGGVNTITGDYFTATDSARLGITTAADEWATRKSDCLLSDFVIYNKVLTSSEVNQCNYEIGVVPKSLHVNCIGHYPFNHRYGKTLADKVEDYSYTKYLIYDNNTGTVKRLGNGANFTVATNEYYAYNSPSLPFNNYTVGTYTLQFTVTRTTGQITVYSLGDNRQAITTSGTFTISNIARSTAYPGLVDTPFYFESFNFVGAITNILFSPTGGTLKQVAPVPANPGALINYTDAEAGVTDPGVAPAWVNHYEKFEVPKYARKFVDNTDRVTSAADYSSLVNSDFTVEFKCKVTSKAFDSVAISFGQNHTNNKAFHIKFAFNKIRMSFWGDDHYATYSYNDKQIHVACAYNHALKRKRIYINGQLAYETILATAFALGTTDGISVGGWSVDANEYLTGYIKNLRIWTVDLPQSQVISNMHRLIGKPTTGLFLEWALGETLNGTVRDTAGTRTGTRAGNSTTIVDYKTGVAI